MKRLLIVPSICLSFLSACNNYNDIKLKVIDNQTQAPLADTYIVANKQRGILPNPFKDYQILYKTDKKGEVIIDIDGGVEMVAFKTGYKSIGKMANTYKNSDPSKDGFVPKTIKMLQYKTKADCVNLDIETIAEYDYDDLTKEFIDYCLKNSITIYRGHSNIKFNLKDDR